MSEIEKLLEITPSGVRHDQPLVELGFRFYAKSKVWRRVQSCKTRGLPPIVSTTVIAACIGIEEPILHRWELATRAPTRDEQQSAADLLAVGPNGEFQKDPLSRWNLCFYPQSGVWRRTRSHRNEVPREDIARRIGVTVEQLKAWEIAALAACPAGRAA